MKSSTPALLLVVASLALTVTCAHGPVDEQRLATPRVDAELALQLAPKVELGTERTLRLVFELEGATRSHARAIETLFAEALAQSPWFDVAASEDAATSDIGPALVVRGNLRADDRSLLTTSLEGDRSVPLAGVRDFAWPELTTALDRLALETRRTLGEPLPSIEAQKSSCAELVSSDLRVASACGSAKDLVAKSRLALADGTLTQALNRDQGCALAMSLLAGIRMDTGRADSAVEFAKRAMQLERRLSPSAAGRAARVVMLAEGRGSAEIVDFADKTLERRPHDKGVLFTKGLALALDARYAEALPILEALRPRFPVSPGLLFALGHAYAATGQIERAKELLPDVDARVPELAAERLRAFVFFAAGEHDMLRAQLDRLEARPAFRAGRARWTLDSMRCAVAILENRDADAISLSLSNLDRLRSLPEVLEERPSVLVEAAWTLARLGAAKEASAALAALRGPQGFAEPARADAAVASGMLVLARDASLGNDRVRNVEELGSRSGARRLEGLAFRKSGRIDRALLSLRAAMPGSSDPTLILEIAECEALAGRVEVARQLRADLVKDVTQPRLDEPREHALLRPSYALALREARRAL